MSGGMKRRAALALSRFLQYWSARAVQEQPLIHETALILQSARVSPEASVGRYSYVRGGALIDAGRIGAFCSIGPHVLIGGDDHPLDAVSTHPFWYARDGLTLPRQDSAAAGWRQPKEAPVIGNDVWIGAGAQVLRGAVVEDGAVIGAGAIVTGRVAAYGIAVGMPAKVVRYRFDAETRERLLQSRWWEKEAEEIARLRPLFADPQAFLAALEKDARNEDADAAEGTGLETAAKKGEAV
ncbi:CatB-related O-acetyltransferase [Cohnella sp. JJ-181]|uniref:CatB-related O-acetyltransferase n=1 Tax=Cohnella rhizoplanae TaxID=2974897 RepID=UPI0022FF72EE|nr:CatB-related O-acetyltransferase [Cohnella sp. JJ-181]CAI6036957.1 2,3,4,5-tetrahydropyridine-2,6-dicarboxylate N-acetyltransferase [Cohnella sp. JJ-181]